MSSLFDMRISITKFNRDKEKEIIAAANSEWDFNEEPEILDIDYYGKPSYNLILSGEAYLGGGESEESFADRVALAIFKANGKVCKLWLNSTYLEDLPTREFIFESKDYKRLMTKNRKEKFNE